MTRPDIQDLFEEDDMDVLDTDEEGEEEQEEGGGDGKRLSGKEEYNRWYKKIWSHDIKEIENTQFGIPSRRWSLFQMIMHCGETHLQSTEVTEQILLVIHQLALTSFLCRVTLLERGIE